MPPPAGQRIASALLAPVVVLLMFKAVQFRRCQVELSGLPYHCQRLPASTGRGPRDEGPPSVCAASAVADSCNRAMSGDQADRGARSHGHGLLRRARVRVNESRLQPQAMRPGLVRAGAAA